MVWCEAVSAAFFAAMAFAHAPLVLIVLAFGSALAEIPFITTSRAAIPTSSRTRAMSAGRTAWSRWGARGHRGRSTDRRRARRDRRPLVGVRVERPDVPRVDRLDRDGPRLLPTGARHGCPRRAPRDGGRARVPVGATASCADLPWPSSCSCWGWAWGWWPTHRSPSTGAGAVGFAATIAAGDRVGPGRRRRPVPASGDRTRVARRRLVRDRCRRTRGRVRTAVRRRPRRAVRDGHHRRSHDRGRDRHHAAAHARRGAEPCDGRVRGRVVARARVRLPARRTGADARGSAGDLSDRRGLGVGRRHHAAVCVWARPDPAAGPTAAPPMRSAKSSPAVPR
jgi:hypothetical protein